LSEIRQVFVAICFGLDEERLRLTVPYRGESPKNVYSQANRIPMTNQGLESDTKTIPGALQSAFLGLTMDFPRDHQLKQSLL